MKFNTNWRFFSTLFPRISSQLVAPKISQKNFQNVLKLKKKIGNKVKNFKLHKLTFFFLLLHNFHLFFYCKGFPKIVSNVQHISRHRRIAEKSILRPIFQHWKSLRVPKIYKKIWSAWKFDKNSDYKKKRKNFLFYELTIFFVLLQQINSEGVPKIKNTFQTS